VSGAAHGEARLTDRTRFVRGLVTAGLALGTLALGTSCPSAPPWAADAGEAAFVHRATGLSWGRRPASFGERRVLEQLAASRGRGPLVEAMTGSPEYLDRWVPALYDHLRVNRVGPRSSPECADVAALEEPDPSLASFVMDTPPTDDFGADWTLLDLTRSALLADDMRPLLLVNLLAQLAPGPEPPNELEAWGQRSNRLEAFAGVYLGRTLPCLPCHNSEFSVTGDPDPALDRTWEVRGHFEEALLGESTGREERDLSVVFRRRGVVQGLLFSDVEEEDPVGDDAIRPWGMSEGCGAWVAPAEVAPDVSGHPGYFGEPLGETASIWDVEALLRQGMRGLDQSGLGVAPDDSVTSPKALAWMTASRFVEGVWEEATGHPLTLSHGFPRNRDQRDLLRDLTDTFVSADWSLSVLLGAIAESAWVNQAAPAATAAGESAYAMPAVFDPFSVAAEDEDARGNSPGDGLHVRSSDALVLAAHRALGWPVPPLFPFALEPWGGARDVGLGSFEKEGESGGGGLSLELMLRWEAIRAECRDPNDRPWGPCEPRVGCQWLPRPRDWDFQPDWVDALVAAAPDATVAEAAEALSERLIGDPRLDGLEGAIEALTGVDLDTPLASLDRPDQPLRRICGALLSTPQFLLEGVPDPSPAERPAALVLPGESEEERCVVLSEALFEGDLDCGADGLE